MARPALSLPSIGSQIVAWLVGALVCAASYGGAAYGVEAQTAVSQSPVTLPERVAAEVEAIDAAARAGMAPLKLGRLWARLASDYEDEMDVVRSEDAYNQGLRLLDAAGARLDYAVVLDNLGSLFLIEGNYVEAERCRRRSLTVREALGDRLEIARGKAHLAEVELGRHRYKDAAQDLAAAYSEMVAQKDPDAEEMVATLSSLVYAECGYDSCVGSLEHAREALLLAHKAFDADSLPVGQAHLALGYAEWKAGMKEGPEEEMLEGIRIMKARTSPTHPYVLAALQQYRAYLESEHRGPEAREIAAQVSQIEGVRRSECINCTVSVDRLRGR
ncbi:hypothetical protein [Edaphobacter bradus]|uniref:hypothetical protein n=1 Tax=Edaphobacter bradus TaxID=2259016 RepID=UPI0021E088EB|nr:hypothetical protein [Edaphobacter bradus]